MRASDKPKAQPKSALASGSASLQEVPADVQERLFNWLHENVAMPARAQSAANRPKPKAKVRNRRRQIEIEADVHMYVMAI